MNCGYEIKWSYDLRSYERNFYNCFTISSQLLHLISYPQFIYDSFHIPFHHWFIPHGTIRTHKWPAPNVSGFIAQLVRASHRNREVTGSNPVEGYSSPFRLLYAIIKIAFITAKIIASLEHRRLLCHTNRKWRIMNSEEQRLFYRRN